MKKGLIKRSIVIASSALFIAAALGGSIHSYADNNVDTTVMTEEEQKAYEDTVEHSQYLPKVDIRSNIDKSYFKEYNSKGTSKDANVPAKYDLTDNTNLSSVKNQDVTGTCWCFSMMECLQDSARIQELSTDPDFSEYDVSYFIYNHSEDKLDLISGDIINSGYTPGSKDYYLIGSNEVLSTMMVASGLGIKNEEKAPFSVLLDKLNNTGLATLPDSTCYRNADYSLAGMKIYDITDEGAINAIKKEIMDRGAGQVAYLHGNDSFNYTTFGYYNDPNADMSEYGGHAVCVVGWDDDYPVENFTCQPEGKGAWLIKNSWGEDWGNNGYFWMSYYEPTLEGVYFYEVEKKSYDNLYQYDGIMSGSSISGYKTGANIYTAQQNETINAISFFTVKDATDCDIYIYKNPSADNPSSGELVYSKSITVDHMGYTKYNLDEQIPLIAGDTFSVVVKQTVSGNASVLYVENDSSFAGMPIDSDSQKGQSFVSRNIKDWNDWTDISEKGMNLRIKAFTTVNKKDLSGDIKLDKTDYNIDVGGTVDCDVLVGDASISSSSVLSFSTGDESIAVVTDMGRIFGRKKGKTTLTVTSGDKTATANVVVGESEQSQIRITKDDGYATEENPCKVNLYDETTLPYTVSPARYKFDVSFNVTVPEGLNPDEAYYRDGGSFRFHKAGIYKITVSIDNSSVEFYIDASVNSVECNAISDLSADPYDTNNIKIYRYDTKKNSSYITFNYDIEEDYDYLNVLGSDVLITDQEIYDINRSMLIDLGLPYLGKYDISKENYDLEQVKKYGALTGKVDGNKISFNNRYLYLIMNSDPFENGYFEVESIEDEKSADPVVPVNPSNKQSGNKQNNSNKNNSGSDSKNKSNTSKSKYSNEWVDGKWYDKDGSQTYTGKISWKCNAKGWWIEDTKGWYPRKTWQKINGEWYYFDDEGYMASSEWVDGYWLDKDGAWRYKHSGTWKQNSKGWWFEDDSKWYAKSGWQKINGKYYYFGANGYMLTKQYVEGYWVGEDGAYVGE